MCAEEVIRPPKKDDVIVIRLDKILKARIQRQLERLGISRSSFARMCILRSIEEEEKKEAHLSAKYGD
jgi:predicted transcriptional regulator